MIEKPLFPPRQQVHSGLITKNKNIQYPVYDFTFLQLTLKKSSEHPLHYIGRRYHSTYRLHPLHYIGRRYHSTYRLHSCSSLLTSHLPMTSSSPL